MARLSFSRRDDRGPGPDKPDHLHTWPTGPKEPDGCPCSITDRPLVPRRLPATKVGTAILPRVEARSRLGTRHGQRASPVSMRTHPAGTPPSCGRGKHEPRTTANRRSSPAGRMPCGPGSPAPTRAPRAPWLTPSSPRSTSCSSPCPQTRRSPRAQWTPSAPASSGSTSWTTTCARCVGRVHDQQPSAVQEKPDGVPRGPAVPPGRLDDPVASHRSARGSSSSPAPTRRRRRRYRPDRRAGAYGSRRNHRHTARTTDDHDRQAATQTSTLIPEASQARHPASTFKMKRAQ